ncbi:MAG: carbohydrate kinase family protein [Candidatus Staskawiczbacteria bacterium]|nr:carbohydrate kinase family protein [Candidatus Staskawiczbacteria bacterium]
MYDIITFGSAAQDIHLKSGAFKTLSDNKDFITGKGICLALGSKVDIDDIIFVSGGGGTNTAATFAKQGFRTAFCGAIGIDTAGLEIVRELKHLKIDTKFVVKKKEKHTNQSIIISNEGQDRTILVYRGASDVLQSKDISWKKIKKTKWIYLAPFGSPKPGYPLGLEGGVDLFEEIVNFAHENGIKIAVNPSMQQLSLPEEKVKSIFSKVDILFLNQEEASFLTKISFEDEKNIFKKIDEICPGIAVMTRGGEGVIVSDGKYLYSAFPNPNHLVVDTTGAGDSFASGFLSDYMRYNGDIEKAIQLGLANSEANLTQIGAKMGILDKDSEFERAKVTKEECGENNLCMPK